jgi:hypothetical protein
MKPPSNVKTPAQYIASLPADRAKTIATLRTLLNRGKTLVCCLPNASWKVGGDHAIHRKNEAGSAQDADEPGNAEENGFWRSPMRKMACTAVIVLFGFGGLAYGQAPANNPYPSMAPVSQYLMPRAAEIEMARSAGPASISAHAEVLVLTKSGYVVAAKGSNGWTCLVGRMWMAGFDDPEFWNPKGRGAGCLNTSRGRIGPWPVIRAKRSRRSVRPPTPIISSPIRLRRRSRSCCRRKAISTMELRVHGALT